MNPNQKKYLLKVNKFGQSVFIVISLIVLFSSILPAQNPLDNVKIGIVFSEQTWNEVHSGDNNFYFIRDWEIFFLDRKISYRVYTDDDLDDYNFDDEDILILPRVEILSDDAVENIKDFMGAGKSIFILGNIGNYKTGTSKRFESICNELTGISPIVIANPKFTTTSITLNSNNPIFNESVDKQLILSGKINCYSANQNNEFLNLGYYSNSDANNNRIQSSIVCGTKNTNRFAWFGFQISQIFDGLSKYSITEKLILNVLQFLGNKTLVSLNNFPSAYNKGVIFINKLKDGKKFQNFVQENNSLSNIPFNNFITPESLDENEIDLNYLKAFGDIHLIYNNINYLNRSALEINGIYQKAANEVENSTDQKSIGILDESPFNLDFKTISVDFTGFNFRMNNLAIVNNQNGNSILYKKFLFAKSSNEDYKELKSENILTDNQILIIPVVDEFNVSKNLNKDEFQSLQINLIKNNCWFTNLNQLINWNELKSNTSFYVNTYKDEKKIEVVVRNNNYVNVSDIGFKLILPEEYSSATTSEIGTRIYFDYNKRVYRLLIESVGANQEKRIVISE